MAAAPRIPSCSVCLGLMRNPEVLPCGHSFCATCIEALPADLTDEGIKACCPLCRVPFALGSSVPNWTLREMLPALPLQQIAREAEADAAASDDDLDPVEISEAVDCGTAAADGDAEDAPEPVDVGAALMACRRFVAAPGFIALTSTFMRQHCGVFDATSEENKLEYTSLHEQYVALVEAELVQGLVETMGDGFTMTEFLHLLPAYLRDQGDDAGSAAEQPATMAGDEDDDADEPATLQDTLAILHRFTSFVDFKADMLAEKQRQQESDAKMRDGMAKYFALMNRS